MIFNHKIEKQDEYKYLFSYEDAFGASKQITIPTCSYYNLHLRISGTASNIMEGYLGQVQNLNPAHRLASIIIAEDRIIPVDYFDKIKLYDIVYVFEHFKLNTTKLYESGWLATIRQPNYFNIHSINIEYLDKQDQVIGTIRIDPYSGFIRMEELKQSLRLLRNEL